MSTRIDYNEGHLSNSAHERRLLYIGLIATALVTAGAIAYSMKKSIIPRIRESTKKLEIIGFENRD